MTKNNKLKFVYKYSFGGRIMRKLRMLIALVLLPTMMFAQSTTAKLAGVVADADGNPLVGANVVVEGSNLGAATDELGRYYILDVPVGNYDLRAEYIGYTTVIESGVRTSVGFTTTVDFNLDVAAVAGQEVTVTRERPLINPNATNTTRVVDKELIDAFAVRGVSNIVNLQTGVVNGFFRGSRSGDSRYYVDGVPVKDVYGGGNLLNGNSQAALQEISVQTGGFSAEYGGANGGIVNITTKTGGSDWSSRVGVETSVGSDPSTDPDKLYTDGYQNVNFDFGGPISENVKVYLSVESKEKGGDVSYSYYPMMDATPMQDAPPADYYSDGSDGLTYATDANGNKILHIETVVRNNVAPTTLGEVLDPALNDTTYVVYSNYRRMYGQQPQDDNERITINGNMTMDFGPLRLKLGTQAYDYEGHSYSWSRVYGGTDGSFINEADFTMGYLNARYTINPLSYIKASLSQQTYESTSGNENYLNNIEEYGRRSRAWGSTNYYKRDNNGLNPVGPDEFVGVVGYGSQYTSFDTRKTTTNTLSFDYTNQIGYNEFKLGASIDNHEITRYGLAASGVARAISEVDANFDGLASNQEIVDAVGVEAAKDWRFINYRPLYVTNLGYNIYGDEWSGQYNQDDHMLAPAEPEQTRFYIQDKLEFKDVVVQLGVSYETIDTGAMAPDSDNDGYGDSDGFNYLYFNRQRVNRNGDGNGNHVWKKVRKETATHPRIGVSFPISDRTVFRANYGTHWQSVPMSFLYLSDSQLSADILQGNATASENPALKPERSTQYEIGIEQRIGAFASIKVEGFYKESKDYLTLANRTEAYTNTGGADTQQNWAQYLNGDVMVSQGLTTNVEMRRTRGLYAQANYTYSEARGTGSYGSQNFYITWIGTDDGYPKAMNLLDYDQTHTANVILDWRSPDATGALANTGFNAVMSFGSGTRFTPSQIYSTVFSNRWEFPEGPVNSGTMPTYTNLDLRVDRAISFGGLTANAYVSVFNALDSEQVNAVYNGTGNVAEDGWIATESGQQWLANRLSITPDIDAQALYQDNLSIPSRWGRPRTVRVGLNISF
jgi:outer membrane receptor protein involved in Fe transport|tara:strand:+ start:8255 stop:11437 length:3183 start_codon:yes stop_codon:yes gene_type:complete